MPSDRRNGKSKPRREFVKKSVATLGAMGSLGVSTSAARGVTEPPEPSRAPRPSERAYNGPYTGENLDHVAFPLGGIGAGMVCLEGTGALSHLSLRHRPERYNEPTVFAGLCLRGRTNAARVLEGPVPRWKLYHSPQAALVGGGKTWGLPRFARVTFEARFPFASLLLEDDALPVAVRLTGWSPFEPGDADASSLPVAALEYAISNRGAGTLEAVLSFHARNFMVTRKDDKANAVKPVPGGFVLWQAGTAEKPEEEGSFAAFTTDPDVRVDHAWFRGRWWDPLTMAWKAVADGLAVERPPVTEGDPAPGGSLFIPFTLGPGATRTLTLLLAWHVGRSALRAGTTATSESSSYRPWYAGRFPGIDEVVSHWRTTHGDLRAKAARFRDCFYDTTLPPEVVEAVGANLAILKTPTVLRQEDGRLWSWEGCADEAGCCHGSCTHVWNYAQAIPHLFPALERTLRETEFNVSQDIAGHQTFRTPLPIRAPVHEFHAAADGQLGGVMKVHREWRLSGDTAWMGSLWPRVRASLDYCMAAWDPRGKGVVEEPHHNTYDIEFWGPDGMCTSFYLGALAAAAAMGEALGQDVSAYASRLEAGRRALETELFNGEYFFQRVEWRDMRAGSPLAAKPTDLERVYSQEARALLEAEGPKYQYGTGCLSDGILGAWMAAVCGVPSFLDPAKVAAHVDSVRRYNFRPDLSGHANPQRPTYACGREAGLLLCTWPRGGKPSLPFVYSDEVWTGIEYQVASHLMMLGRVEAGLEIVRACRARYGGRVRNPFDEYECGHWYARAMSSYALLQGLTGAGYDAVSGTLHLHPRVAGDFRSFLATARGYGTVGVRRGQPFLEVKAGAIDVRRYDYVPFAPSGIA
jgi:uncharacterized protein (DUF608 family)